MTSIKFLTAALLLLFAPIAEKVVHGEGVLTADRGTMASGESLALKGASFEPGEAYQIKLVGALQEFVLGTAHVGADSTFALTVAIPHKAKEGSYRIQAVAEDGDISAALDVTLLATAPVANDRSTQPMTDMSEMTGPMARADEVPINRNQTGAGWAIIGVLIGLCAGLGIGLLSRGRTGSLVGRES